MKNDILATVAVENFDFEEFLAEIRRNLSRELNGEFIPKYVERVDEIKYIDMPVSDYEGLTPCFIYDDISNNDRLLYVSFIYNCQTYGTGGFLVGNGDEMDPNTTYYGEIANDDVGFLVESKEGHIIFRKAEYGGRIQGNYSVSHVKNCGDFEFVMEEFIRKYIY